jgi:hypothetical protein
MPLLSHPVRLIDDWGAIGLRQYQHAAEDYKQAEDEAGAFHGVSLNFRVALTYVLRGPDLRMEEAQASR